MGEGVGRLWHDRAACLHAIQLCQPHTARCGQMGSSDDEVKEESVREERGGGGEGVFSWCVNTLICSSSYVKHTSSQLELE
jgi:hypothetical protein